MRGWLDGLGNMSGWLGGMRQVCVSAERGSGVCFAPRQAPPCLSPFLVTLDSVIKTSRRTAPSGTTATVQGRAAPPHPARPGPAPSCIEANCRCRNVPGIDRDIPTLGLSYGNSAL